MRRMVLVFAIACSKDEPQPPPSPKPVVAPAIDAAVGPSVKELAKVGYVDEPVLILDGAHVYFWFADDSGYGFRRVPRAGGAVEAVAGKTVHAGVTYDIEAPALKKFVFDAPVHLIRIDGDKRTKLGTAKGGLGGKHFTFAGGYVYWIGAYSTGVGLIHATQLSDGKTKRVLGCGAEAPAEDCPEIVTGTTPMATHDNVLYRLEGGDAKRIDAKCPVDPASKVAMTATRVVDDHVLCEMVDFGWYELEKKPLPEPVLLALADGKTKPARGLGDFATRVRGHWYHRTEAGIARRATLDGVDEIVVPLRGNMITALAADDAGVVWILDDKLWSAPLP